MGESELEEMHMFRRVFTHSRPCLADVQSKWAPVPVIDAHSRETFLAPGYVTCVNSVTLLHATHMQRGCAHLKAAQQVYAFKRMLQKCCQ